MNPKTHLLTVHTVTSWETNGDFWELTLISSTEEWKHYMHAALQRGWPLAMVIQIHQKVGDLGEGSTRGSLYLVWYCIIEPHEVQDSQINIIIAIKHGKHISIAIKGTGGLQVV